MLKIITKSIRVYRQRQGSFIAASIAYYSLFALVSLFVLSLIIINQIFGPDEITSQLATSLRHTIDPVAFQTVEQAVTTAYSLIENQGIGILSLVIIIWSVFSWTRNLQLSFLKVTHTTFAKPTLTRQIYAFLIVVLLGLFLTLLNIDALLVWFNYILLPPDVSHFIIVSTKLISGILLLWFCLTWLYLTVFPKKIAFKASLIGSFYTSLLLIFARILIDTLIHLYQFPNLFGTAGTIIIYLYWLYYIAQVLLLGMIIVYEIDQKS